MGKPAVARFFRRKIWFRTLVQAFFFVLIALIAVNHTLVENGGQGFPFLAQASVHALCPFGGVVTIYQYVTAGTYLPKIQPSALILMWVGLLLALLFGPVLCGWVCPFGTFQEWFGRLGRTLFRRKYNHFVPSGVDRVLRYVRYLVLAWVVYATAISASLVFADYDPYFVLFHFWTGELALGAVVLLGATMVGTLFVERPWCKYACPYGALLGIFNLFRVFHIVRREGTCQACSACNNACPMNIPVSELEVVRDHQCITCMECTTEASCPAAATVVLTTGR
jgi:polyferredoxin